MFPANDKDRQGELFNDLAKFSQKPKRSKSHLGRVALTLSYENLIIFAIGLIMFLIACYTLGVEKGRQLAQYQQPEVTQEQVQTAPEQLPAPKAPKKVKVELAQMATEKASSAYIQVASFRTNKYARKEILRLENKGYQPYLTTWGKYKVVCVGGYKDKDAAKLALRKLKKLYADCILRDE